MPRKKAETGKTAAVSLVAGWFLTLTLQLILTGGGFTRVAYAQNRLAFVVIGTVLLGALIIALAKSVPGMEKVSLGFSALLMAAVSFAYFPKFYYLIGLLTALALVALYLLDLKERDRPPIDVSMPNRAVRIWFWVLGVLFTAVVGGFGAIRYLNFFTPNFDFGLFCNMFYNMSKRFLPLVTSERDMLLSHFAVHISPIYYLLLPLYMLFPSPITLQVGQAAVIASGLIPLYLLAKERKLSKAAVAALAALYVFFPALAGGTLFDLHENKFLTALILWLCWAYERKKTALMYGFALLICLVKEDAPVYVMFFALYLLLERKEYKRGAALFAGAFAYFLAAVFLLETFGEGIMSYRYSNVVYGNKGLIGVIKTAVVNPLLLLKESFEPEKLLFLLLMLAPLGFLPLMSRRLSSFILLAPMMLVNLIPDYKYQHSIFFQYTYGVAGFLFYLTVKNLADLERGVLASRAKAWVRRAAYGAVVLAACVLFVTQLGGSWAYYYRYFTQSAGQRAVIAGTLDAIPRDASVQASTFFVARLSRRDVIYEYPSRNETEYIVLDLRFMSAEKAKSEIGRWQDRGYVLTKHEPGVILVLKKSG